MNQETFGALLARQQELEDHALARGAKRFRDRLQAAAQQHKGSTAGAARKLLQEALVPTEAAMQAFIDANAPGKWGRAHAASKWVALVGADVAAYMTVKTVLDHAGSRVLLRKAALSVVELLLDEVRYRRFRDLAPGLFDYKLRSFSTSSYAHMARSMDAAIAHARCQACRAAERAECDHLDMSDLDLPLNTRLVVGVKLVDLMIDATALVEIEDVLVQPAQGRGKPHTEKFLVPTPETAAWLKQRNAVLEMLWPVNLPMVVPPMPWGARQRGGYRFALRGKHPFVRGVSRAHARTLAHAEMPTVYEAVNRIQETAWRINPAVLQLVRAIMQRGGGIAGLPSADVEALPPRPADITTNETSRKAWRKAAHQVHERNHARQVKAKEFGYTLQTALSVEHEAAIWFPCNVDFRGRVYPICNYLNPQGDDLSKALLTFAQGKPVGEDGPVWLAAHGANCLGETPDKVKLTRCTIQERVDWIVAHTNEITQAAEQPFADLWWAQADDPLQFFAFCVEWANYARATRQGRGADYICTLPCAMDGTCNGLQHYAAMLRDPVGGAAVNVVPAERPQDIYTRIAEAVLTRLEPLAGSDPVAAKWLASGLVTRKLTKRPTMTFGYGSKQFGFKQQLKEYLLGHDEWPRIKRLFSVEENDGKELPAACALMARLIWESLQECVVAAFDGMAWMQKAVRGVVANGRCVEWTAPGTGFPVRQEYMRLTKKQVQTVLAGKVFKPQCSDVTDEPNPVKQANAVAPNFVHSLDAACLMRTVVSASRDGVEAFGMVHDSYATVAADCAVLARCTREAFFQLYQADVIGDFAAQLRQQHKEPEQMPEPPAKGALDLSGVLTSTYFFS